MDAEEECFVWRGPFDRLKAAKQKLALSEQSALRAPIGVEKGLDLLPAWMKFLIRSPSPDWIRRRIYLSDPRGSAVNLDLSAYLGQQ